MVKNPLANAGNAGSIPGSGRSPGGGNGNPLSILAWKIPQTEDPAGLQSTGSQSQICLVTDHKHKLNHYSKLWEINLP